MYTETRRTITEFQEDGPVDFNESFLGPALKEIGETTVAKAQMKFDRVSSS